jgi:hypothetical protein
MTNNLKKIYTAICCLLLINVLANGQLKICSEKLQQAQQLFESGQIEQIPSLLDSCIKLGFNKNQKIQAYRLLIQTYLFDSNLSMADSIMLKLLNQNPDYKIVQTDPVEFAELYNAFKVKYNWAIGITIGTNISEVMVNETYSLFNANKLNSTFSPDGTGFEAGIYVNKYLKNNLWISVAANYCALKYMSYEINSYNTEHVTFKENSQWLSIPVTYNQSFLSAKIKPFIQLGGEFNYLSSVNCDIQRVSFTNNTPTTIINGSSINLDGYRNKLNLSVLGGIGAVLNTKAGLFQVIAGFKYFLLPYINGNERYANNNLIYYYQHIDDNLKINNIYFSLGYSHLFYKIRKKINEASN